MACLVDGRGQWCVWKLLIWKHFQHESLKDFSTKLIYSFWKKKKQNKVETIFIDSQSSCLAYAYLPYVFYWCFFFLHLILSHKFGERDNSINSFIPFVHIIDLQKEWYTSYTGRQVLLLNWNVILRSTAS